MMAGVLLLLAVLLPGREPPVEYLDYQHIGVPVWYPDMKTCERGQDALLVALERGILLPEVAAMHRDRLYAFCLWVPLEGLPFHGRGR